MGCLARIIHRVEEAQDAKAGTERFMDRFSVWYTPGILVLALVLASHSRSFAAPVAVRLSRRIADRPMAWPPDRGTRLRSAGHCHRRVRE